MATTNHKKVVKVQNTNGYEYLTIYEIRVHIIKSDEKWTADRYLNKKDAEKAADFYREHHKSLYDRVWITESMVWCK